MLATAPSHQALYRDLVARIGEGRVSIDPADRLAVSRDMWPRMQIAVRAGRPAPHPPAAVVWPESTEQVANLVRFAIAHRIALVPFGGGSGVCGGIQPDPDAVVVDLKRMHAIRHMDRDRLVVEVEAGIVGQHLEDALLAHGLTLGHYPSSIHCSTLGGWIAARSAGQCSGRYGKIEDMLVGLTAVDGRGERLTVDRERDPGSFALLVGNEGAWAIVTEARLRVAFAPTSRTFASFSFGSTEAGLEAVRELVQSGLRPAVVRLYDPFDSWLARRPGRDARDAEPRSKTDRGRHWLDVVRRRAVRALLGTPALLNELFHAVPAAFWGGALLVLVWEDDPAIAAAELAQAHRIARRHGGRDLGPGPAEHWLAKRHAVSHRQAPLFVDGGFVDTMEVAAPWSRLHAMHEAVRSALARHVTVMAHFSHAYPDGASIYFTFAGAGRTDAESLERYDSAWRDALDAVVRVGGTTSHHHGIGRSKVDALRAELGTAVSLLEGLKATLDPHGVLNPGVLIGEGQTADRARANGPASNGRHADPTASDGGGGGVEAFRADLQTRRPGLWIDGRVAPATIPDVEYVVRLAARRRVRLRVPGGLDIPGAVALDLSRLGHVLAFDDVSRIVHVGAGASLVRLESDVRDRGLTLGVEMPAADVCVAEWLALGAPGHRLVADDPVDQLVAGLDVVLPDGRAAFLRPAPRRATGPDLVAAFVGARGRLGVIVAAHLVLRPQRSLRTLCFAFDTPEAAHAALASIRGHGVRPVRALVEDSSGERFVVRVDLDALATALPDVVRRLCTRLGGREVGPSERRTPSTPQPPKYGAVLDALADWLDAHRIFAMPPS
ncbi:MAG: FAD-binding protein [Myxococcota bacterium]|nr:FAD-binding protein [Myxococcota bacterium]